MSIHKDNKIVLKGKYMINCIFYKVNQRLVSPMLLRKETMTMSYGIED